jgi:hypothetical protein
MDVEAVEFNVVDRIHLMQGEIQWRALRALKWILGFHKRPEIS